MNNPAGEFALVDQAELATTALANWALTNAVLMKLNRRQVANLLWAELRGKRRRNIVRRLHQRLCRLRALDEEGALAQGREFPNEQSFLHSLDWLRREVEP